MVTRPKLIEPLQIGRAMGQRPFEPLGGSSLARRPPRRRILAARAVVIRRRGETSAPVVFEGLFCAGPLVELIRVIVGLPRRSAIRLAALLLGDRRRLKVLVRHRVVRHGSPPCPNKALRVPGAPAFGSRRGLNPWGPRPSLPLGARAASGRARRRPSRRSDPDASHRRDRPRAARARPPARPRASARGRRACGRC